MGAIALGGPVTIRIRFLLGALALAVPGALSAQAGISALAAGTRVKIVTPALEVPQQTGRIVEAGPDTIVFRADGFPVTRALALTDIASIAVSGGSTTHLGRDALYGLAIGVTGGAVTGALSYKKPRTTCYILCETRAGDAAAGAFLGGAMGALVGAVIGVTDRSERWVTIKDSRRIAIGPSQAGAAVVLNYRF